jgi:protein phosphatase
VRESNQDAVLAGPSVFVVADGMGGHAAGDVASALAVGALAHVPPGIAPADAEQAVRDANQAVVDGAAPGSGREGMGTTITGVVLGREDDHDVIVVVNVGDSRTYRWLDGRLELVTEDHSLVREMVRDGEITAEEAHDHPARNVVTRALGLEGHVVVDRWVEEPVVGARYLACSDGLTGEVADAEIAALVGATDDPQRAADALLEAALAAGGRDNVSVVLVSVVGVDGGATAAETDTNPRLGLTAFAEGVEDADPEDVAEGSP